MFCEWKSIACDDPPSAATSDEFNAGSWILNHEEALLWCPPDKQILDLAGWPSLWMAAGEICKQGARWSQARKRKRGLFVVLKNQRRPPAAFFC